MNETTKHQPVSRECDSNAYNAQMKHLIAVCEAAVINAFERDDKMDIIIAQKKLINVLRLGNWYMN